MGQAALRELGSSRDAREDRVLFDALPTNGRMLIVPERAKGRRRTRMRTGPGGRPLRLSSGAQVRVSVRSRLAGEAALRGRGRGEQYSRASEGE